jgi:hypothetical protein
MTDKLSKMGRPPKHSPEMFEAICRVAKERPSKIDQAAAVGITPRTLRNWLKKGSEGHPDFIGFYADYQMAMGKFKTELINNLREAAALVEKPHSTRANEWLLKNFFGDEFSEGGSATTINVQQNIGQQVNLKELPTEKLDALLGEIDAIEAEIVTDEDEG